MASQLTSASVSRSLLKEQAYAQIKLKIQDGTFAPGGFLSERRLAQLLGMSKTPIKAALERLQQEGFVAVSPQQGIVVRELSVKEIADQFELRRALECFVVRSIAGKLNEKQLAPFERNLRQQQTAASKDLVSKLVELDAEFHMLLCEIFGNLAILQCLAQHRSKMHRVIFQVMSQAPGRLLDAVREHEAIFDAVKSGKPQRAVQLVEKHLEFGQQYLLSSRWA